MPKPRTIIEDACGEYRRPFLSEGPFEENLIKIEPGSLKNRAREEKNGGPEGVWEVSWAIFPKKMSRRRSWPILAGRGNPKMSGRWPKMAPRWGPHEAKMEPRWPKNEPRWPFGEPRWPKRGPRWPSGGPLGSYLEDCWRSWARSLPRSPKYKIEQPYNVFGGFWGPWGSRWRLLVAILGDFGCKLGYVGQCWRQVGCKLAYVGRFDCQVGTFLARCWDKDAEDEPR